MYTWLVKVTMVQILPIKGIKNLLKLVDGVHDRAWFPRKVFGNIRFMSESGAQTKFDVGAYIKKWTGKEYAKKKKSKHN